jgi:hypothetical protein
VGAFLVIMVSVVVTNFPPPRSEGIVVWHVSSYPETS